ncbi:hypothetical protein CAEBREN_20667 [Caenorhabditis brenneri]|uniref:protein-tyrosine-phosphatase n=1 Tax=Caenorhabditis brenneri TaxID=135651 RepID=G0PHZ8_CAEBE|nr:hypothetical protein CAEBREN_20667 [Caenorhabditis brenneri]
MNVEVVYQLTTVSSNCSTCFRRIDASVLMDLLHTHSEDAFNMRYVLVDCRYPFEFDGGHIKHAINFYDRETINRLFFDENKTPKHQKIPIFYCEFSQKRAPKMADALRVFDRNTNEMKYPHCSFAEMYVLDKGYRNFFDETRIHNENGDHVSLASGRHKSNDSPDRELGNRVNSMPWDHGFFQLLCIPNAYIEMLHKDFLKELKSFQYHKKMKPGKPVYKSHSTPENLVSLRNSDQAPLTPSRAGKMSNLESPETPPSRGLIKHKSQRNLLRDRFNDNTESTTGISGKLKEEGEDESKPSSLKGSKKRGGLAFIENDQIVSDKIYSFTKLISLALTSSTHSESTGSDSK